MGGARRMSGDRRLGPFGLIGLSGSVSMVALMAPGAVLAQEETTLPEIRVIAPTPVPASPRRPARPAPAQPTRQARTQPQAPAPPVAAPPTPEPGLIDRDKVPSTTHTLTSQDFQPWLAPTVTDALTRVVPSVSTSDTAVNPFQPDLTYRGFLASPTVGTPQGLAIYQNGVRINESFGDTVNWDFIPERAIRRLDLFPSNPVFGLNAIGGAISIEMKNGFNYKGGEIEGIVGSFGRRSVGAQYGAEKDNVAFYAAADAINDSGWRQRSPSELRRIYTDVGVRGDDAEFHLNFTGASNRFGALAPTPIEMLNRNWSSVYTSPQTYKNQLAFLNATGSYRLSDTWTVKGNAYIRSFRQQHVDGNVSEAQPCDPGPGLCFGDTTTPLIGLNGNQVPDILGGAIAGSIDRTQTNAVTVGGTVQAASSDKLFGRENQFVVGASLDHGDVRFKAASELGTIGSDLFITGTGVIIAQPDGVVAPVDLKTRNTYYGFYATDTIDLTSRLSLTAGGRFNLAQIKLLDQLGDDLNGSHQFSRFNPVIGATYKLTPNATLYAGYSEANRAPTPSELACSDPARPCLLDNFLVSDPPLKQVVTRTYEAGIRGQLPLGKTDRFNWSFGVFTADSADDIIRVLSEIAGRGSFQNAGTTRRQGIEASANYSTGPWTVFATYSLVDATFRDTLTLASPHNPLADNGEITVRPGNRLPGVPRHRFKAGADYKVWDDWTVGADMIAVSGQYLVGDESNLNPKLPGYWVANLHTTYKVSKQVEVFGMVRNVFDKRYYTAGTFFEVDAVPFLGLSDPRTVSPGAPRAFYAGLRGKF
jgi:iron complex outermembrane recepter protein